MHHNLRSAVTVEAARMDISWDEDEMQAAAE